MTLNVDPSAEAVLRQRWSRCLRQLFLVSLVFPASIALYCLVMAGLPTIAWPAVVPPVVAALAAVALRRWFRRQTPLDPSSWLPATILTAGAQLMLGAVPGYCIALVATTGAWRTAATVLFALCWVLATAMCVSALRAARTLLTPLVAELGSTDVRLVLSARVPSCDDVEAAHVVVDRDRIEWSVRLPRARVTGSRRFGMSVPFGQLHQVTPATLSSEPASHPWLMLPDGTALNAEPGPAVALETVHGGWLIPVHDAMLVAELVNRRRELWALEKG